VAVSLTWPATVTVPWLVMLLSAGAVTVRVGAVVSRVMLLVSVVVSVELLVTTVVMALAPGVRVPRG